MDAPADKPGQVRGARGSRLAVATALAMVAVAAVVVVAVDSDRQAQEAKQADAKPATPLVGAEGSAFAFGRGATDPAAAASSAASKGQSALYASGLSDLDVCVLLRDASVTSAIGSGWRASPSSAIGTPQCRWWLDRERPLDKPEGEIKVTVSRAGLYEELARSEAVRLPGLGEQAVASGPPSAGWVAIRSGDVSLLLARSSARGTKVDTVTLATEAFERLATQLGGEGKR